MIVFLVTCCAALLSGITGFGYGVVAMSVLPLFLSLKTLNPAITILSAGIFLYILAVGWRHIRIRELIPLLAGSMVGIPAGIFFLARVDEGIIKRVMGIVLVLFILHSLAPVPQFRRKVTAPWGLLAGMVGGAMGGALSMGGPPVVIYLTLRAMNKDEMRSSLAIYFVLIYLYKIPLLFVGGFFTAEVGTIILIMLVPTILGVVAGHYLGTRISSRIFRWILLALLAVTASIYLFKG